MAKTPCALFPGVFTDVCTKELCQLDSFIDKFNRANVKVIGVSCDSPFALKMCIPNNIEFAWISDYNPDCIDVLGVLFIGLSGMGRL